MPGPTTRMLIVTPKIRSFVGSVNRCTIAPTAELTIRIMRVWGEVVEMEGAE